MDDNKKKAKISITLEEECMNFVIKKSVKSKSDFINDLLCEYFDKLDVNKNKC